MNNTSSVRRRKNFDDSLLLYEIKKRIEESQNKEIEVVVTEYAKLLDVTDPTIKYHVDKFIESGELILINRVGAYGRKIVTLPQYGIKEKELEIGLGEKEAFEKFIEDSLKELSIPLEEDSLLITEVEPQPEPEPEPKLEIQEEIQEENSNIDIEFKEDPIATVEVIQSPELVVQEAKPHKELDNKDEATPIESKEERVIPMSKEEMYQALSLDDKIEDFISRSNDMYDANVLLKQSDKEILSVMHETIQRNILYLKDLSDELGTVKNRELIKSLIDEREKMTRENKELQKELIALRDKQEVADSEKINPQRVRELQQKLVSHTSIYLNSSSESIALNRKKFIKEFIENVSELVDYSLGYDKK